MASRKQIAAARRNIKKAQRARRAKLRGRKRSKRSKKSRKKRTYTAQVVAKATRRPAKRRKRRAKRRAAKRRPSRRRSRRRTRRTRRTQSMRVGRVQIVKVPQTKTVVVSERKSTRRRSRRRRRRREEELLLENPSTLLAENPYRELDLEENPFRAGSMASWGTVAIGLGVGLAAADMLDRFVATRKPEGGQNPWYGAAAAGAQQRRPDAMRLGAQAGGSLVALGAAYMTRRVRFAPWLFSGVALGAGANFVKMLINWYAMPAIFKTQSPTEATFANRMYPLEQSSIQEQIDKFFESWQSSQALSSNQAATPVVTGVRNDPTHAAVLAGRYPGASLGKAQTAGDQGNLGAAQVIPTGRIGECAACKGMNGCYASCPDLVLCGECGSGLTARRCRYTVQPGDDLVLMASAAGIDINQVNELNEGSPDMYWQPGQSVTLPFAFCTSLEQQTAAVTSSPAVVPSSESLPAGTVPATPMPTGPQVTAPAAGRPGIPRFPYTPPAHVQPSVRGAPRMSLFGIGSKED